MVNPPQLNAKTAAEDAAHAFASHIRGRHVIVTGVSLGGIGFETARVIAQQQPGSLTLAGRSADK